MLLSFVIYSLFIVLMGIMFGGTRSKFWSATDFYRVLEENKQNGNYSGYAGRFYHHNYMERNGAGFRYCL